ncbi:MAG: hypothetical protein ABSG68_22570 [Thermoguttaceae bacterium]|jgi:hypothetical protein
MNQSVRRWLWVAAVLTVAVACEAAFAQDATEPKPKPAAKPAPKSAAAKPAAAKPAARRPAAKAGDRAGAATVPPPEDEPFDPKSPYRHLVPGVLQSVVPERTLADTYSRHDVVELLAVDPSFDFAKDVPFRHDVWTLDFKFKPVRLIDVDVPQPNGQMRRKLIWYMVYSVTNSGKVMHPVEGEDKTFKVIEVDRPIRFIPIFTLEAHNRLQDETAGFTKAYTDRFIPVAYEPIQRREDPHRHFVTTVQAVTIPVGQTVWGIATWEDVDLHTVWFSVHVEGLTNAYRWNDEPGEYTAGSPLGTGRRIMRKTLTLNFWRAGDEYYPKESEIRYGIPGRVDYEWVYR